MEQADGFQKKGVNGEKLVYKLNKSLYGLKQSGRMWNQLLHAHFIDNGFTQCPTEHCLYTKETKEGMILILVWVDDLIVGGKNENIDGSELKGTISKYVIFELIVKNVRINNTFNL